MTFSEPAHGLRVMELVEDALANMPGHVTPLAMSDEDRHAIFSVIGLGAAE